MFSNVINVGMSTEEGIDRMLGTEPWSMLTPRDQEKEENNRGGEAAGSKVEARGKAF